ncbi:lymphatic vessel endothelial hyaluronic acid receptor 1-like, partial [Clarias magur]
YPKNGGIAKVFLVQLKNQAYKFNATTAIDVCTRMGVSIATRAQVETAHRNGLETCRYGWVMEKIAVIPRTKENPNCGKNKTGVIAWSALPSQLFDTFCFNSTGQTETTTSTDSNMTTVSPGTTDAKTTTSSIFKSIQLNKNFTGSSLPPQPISPGFNSSVLPTTFSSTVAPMTTKRSQTSTPSSSLPSARYQPSISSSFFTSITYTDLSSHHVINSSSVTIFYNETDDPSPSGKGFSFGAVPIACVFLVVMLLVMAGIGTFWYLK